jgi:hypothetical protein
MATDVRQLAVDAVLDHQWGATTRSMHRNHDHHCDCAVCVGDVAAVVAVVLKVVGFSTTTPEGNERDGKCREE